MSKLVEVWDLRDLADEAILIKDDSPCCGGPYCPRCRAAIAQARLNERFELPHNHGDGAVRFFVAGMPERKPWGKPESDAEIKRRVSDYVS